LTLNSIIQIHAFGIGIIGDLHLWWPLLLYSGIANGTIHKVNPWSFRPLSCLRL